MADDRMKNDDREQNMGAGGSGEKHGQQSPGRSKQDDEQFGQRGGGQGTTGHDMDDDEPSTQQGGRTGQTGRQNQGGQNR